MNALAIYKGDGFDTMQRTAKAMVASGYFKDSRDVAQAVVKVMAGAELGIAPFAAMSGIHIVQGKPTLSSNLIATLVKNDSRYNYRVKVSTDTECTLTWFENGNECGESSFTMKEAQTANLTGKAVWKSYPSDMLFARALTRGARRFAPGIFGGSPVYTPEEVGADVTPDGDIINGEIVTPSMDSRAETSPQAQAMRQRPTAETVETVNPRDELAAVERPIIGDIVKAAVTSGRYRSDDHALNAIKKYDGFPDGYEVEPQNRIKRENALIVFDWLIARKDSEQEPMFD